MTHHRHHDRTQLGGASFRTILIIGVVIFFAVILLVIATAPPPSDTTTQKTGDGQQETPGERGDNSTQADGSTQVVRLPEGFRRFTNKQHHFSAAFPSAWGNLTQITNAGGTILLAETAPVTHPLGSAQLTGKFVVEGYLTDGLTMNMGSGLVISPSKDPATGDKPAQTTWKVVSARSGDSKFRTGNTYPVASTVTPAGVTVFRFDRLIDGKRQIRWGFEADYEFIVMALPPISRADGSQATGSDLAFYDTFAKSIIGTVSIPKE